MTHFEKLIVWHIGNEIAKSGLSERQFAIKMGIDPSNLNKIMRYKKSPLARDCARAMKDWK